MKFKVGQRVRHKTSGKFVTVLGFARVHKGVVKIETDDPDLGPMDERVFEAAEGEVLVEAEEEAPEEEEEEEETA
jgi:hypothetical protein